MVAKEGQDTISRSPDWGSSRDPFQCNVYVFRTLTRWDPGGGSPRDSQLQTCIRRVLLDSLWSRERKTVGLQCNNIARSLKLDWELGIQPMFPLLGPFPLADMMGYAVAVNMVHLSLIRGKYGDYL
jgi:hypothetical protein